MLNIDLSNIFSQLAQADPLYIALGIFIILLLCGFGLPLPEDITLAFTGYVCYLGILPVEFGIILGMLGVLIGDSTLWYIGHRYGQDVVRLRLFRSLLPPPRLKKIGRLYAKYGTRILFGARFSPGIRAGIFLFAGQSGVTYRRFVMTDGLAALLSVPAIVGAAYYFGSEIERVLKAMRGVQHWILIALVLIVLGHLLYSYVNRRRERRLAAAESISESAKPAPLLEKQPLPVQGVHEMKQQPSSTGERP